MTLDTLHYNVSSVVAKGMGSWRERGRERVGAGCGHEDGIEPQRHRVHRGKSRIAFAAAANAI